MPSKTTYLILDNIRSAENVGAIFRTADAFGVSKIFLLGITPLPIDKFGRPSTKVSKAALGAEKSVVWEHSASAAALVKKIKAAGFAVVSLEQAHNSVLLKKFKRPANLALVVGNEVDGVSKNILKLSDSIVEIPMQGSKESLNVSVATGVALYALN